MREGLVKATKGLIRAEVKVRNNTIVDVRISGDFFIYPEEALWEIEKRLVGVKLSREEILKVIRDVFNKFNVQAPMVKIEDFVEAIMRGASNEVESHIS